MLHDKLIFIIGAPRSGTTLLQRMLASHGSIHTHPEPHLLTPLYYLGYDAIVTQAPYDHINAAEAQRQFVQALPGGEADYRDALRAYASTLYERALAPSGKSFFLDKTPAYALVLPFITQLYPRAKYVVLTRHPLAIMHSVADTFFGGNWIQALQANPILERYVPAIGEFLLNPPAAHVHVLYEELVKAPVAQMQRVLEYLDLPFEQGVVDYGAQPHIAKSFGDPINVHRHRTPVTDYVDQWVVTLRQNPTQLAAARQAIAPLKSAHLEAWGYPLATLLTPLQQAQAEPVARPPQRRRPRFNTYRLKRRLLLLLRKSIHTYRLDKVLKKVRYVCDLLLRP